jgi:predicted peptidase
MHTPFRLSVVVVVSLGCFSSIRAADEEDQKDKLGKQQRTHFEATVKVELDYLLYLPQDYEKQEKWPLLLFLHGAGERGNNLDLVTIHGPPKRIAAGDEFPFIVVSPQCPKDKWWDPVALTALLDELVEKHKVDTDRIVVTGLSMGGFGTWSLAAHTPGRFAAIAPICGGGDPIWARRITHLPTWVFHGAKDGAVPLERSQQMVNELRRRSGNVTFTVYPEAEHDSWTETYNNPELYTWMLEQRRTDPPPRGR